jgi:ABC-2 type transport system ATP-binding protein
MKTIIDHVSYDYKTKIRPETPLGRLGGLVRPKYRTINALTGINIEIAAGELVAVVGENGAGKSTLIKLLSGIMPPSSGTITIGDYVPSKSGNKYLRHIGVVWGNRTQLWWDLRPEETYQLFGKIYEVNPQLLGERIREVVEFFEMKDFWDQPVRKLSLGQRMRAELGLSLIHAPKLLFLDEPTIGLDVSIKKIIRQYIRDWAQRNDSTIILTSHDLKDVSNICDRLILMQKGEIKYNGPISTVASMCRNYPRLEVVLTRLVPVDLLSNLEVIEMTRRDAAHLNLVLKGETHVDTAITRLKQLDPEAEINIGSIDIEELFAMRLI